MRRRLLAYGLTTVLTVLLLTAAFIACGGRLPWLANTIGKCLVYVLRTGYVVASSKQAAVASTWIVEHPRSDGAAAAGLLAVVLLFRRWRGRRRCVLRGLPDAELHVLGLEGKVNAICEAQAADIAGLREQVAALCKQQPLVEGTETIQRRLAKRLAIVEGDLHDSPTSAEHEELMERVDSLEPGKSHWADHSTLARQVGELKLAQQELYDSSLGLHTAAERAAAELRSDGRRIEVLMEQQVEVKAGLHVRITELADNVEKQQELLRAISDADTPTLADHLGLVARVDLLAEKVEHPLVQVDVVGDVQPILKRLDELEEMMGKLKKRVEAMVDWGATIEQRFSALEQRPPAFGPEIVDHEKRLTDLEDGQPGNNKGEFSNWWTIKALGARVETLAEKVVYRTSGLWEDTCKRIATLEAADLHRAQVDAKVRTQSDRVLRIRVEKLEEVNAQGGAASIAGAWDEGRVVAIEEQAGLHKALFLENRRRIIANEKSHGRLVDFICNGCLADEMPEGRTLLGMVEANAEQLRRISGEDQPPAAANIGNGHVDPKTGGIVLDQPDALSTPVRPCRVCGKECSGRYHNPGGTISVCPTCYMKPAPKSHAPADPRIGECQEAMDAQAAKPARCKAHRIFRCTLDTEHAGAHQATTNGGKGFWWDDEPEFD